MTLSGGWDFAEILSAAATSSCLQGSQLATKQHVEHVATISVLLTNRPSHLITSALPCDRTGTAGQPDPEAVAAKWREWAQLPAAVRESNPVVRCSGTASWGLQAQRRASIPDARGSGGKAGAC